MKKLEYVYVVTKPWDSYSVRTSYVFKSLKDAKSYAAEISEAHPNIEIHKCEIQR